MSDTIKYPFNPIDWQAGPIDTHNHDYNLGLRAHGTVQQHAIGRRHITFDGRVYRYCLATTGGVDGYHACKSLAGDALGEALATAQSIGDTEITVTETGFTLDELAGGYVFIYGASGGGSLHYIIGNDVSGATTTRVKLLDPLHEAITTNYCEMFYNPYGYCTMTATGKAACIAVPACTAASGEYFWGQTWGPCVVSPGETITPSADIRQLVFGSNNAVFLESHGNDYQHAGFVMNYNSDNGPLMMLQISI
jgi:hypothetical protein